MSTGSYFGEPLKEAAKRDDVPMSRLDGMVHRILRTMFAEGVFDNPPVVKPIDVAADAAVAQRVEEEGAVLLKNIQGELPLNESTIRSIAVIGSHADVGVLSGGGSAQVDPVGGNAVGTDFYGEIWNPSSPLKAIRSMAPNAIVKYNAGTNPGAAAKLAAASQVAIVFANQWTHENADLPNLRLPDHQDQVIEAVAAANRHTIVVLENGDPVLMPWLSDVQAELEAWYLGQRGGQAIANILFGEVDPSGKLPLTFPKCESQLPRRHVSQPPQGEGYFDVHYTEGLEVGYKWYEAKSIMPLFPFGYGLSYTKFDFSNIKLTPVRTDGTVDFEVSFDIRNTGTRTGAEVAEVYLGLPARTDEPPKRLVGWARVELAPDKVRRVTVTLNPRSASHPLSFWNATAHKWDTADGQYKVYVGDSSQDTYLTDTFVVRHAHRGASVQ